MTRHRRIDVIIGKNRTGKSTTAKALAQIALQNGDHVHIVDPQRSWEDWKESQSLDDKKKIHIYHVPHRRQFDLALALIEQDATGLLILDDIDAHLGGGRLADDHPLRKIAVGNAHRGLDVVIICRALVVLVEEFKRTVSSVFVFMLPNPNDKERIQKWCQDRDVAIDTRKVPAVPFRYMWIDLSEPNNKPRVWGVEMNK